MTKINVTNRVTTKMTAGERTYWAVWDRWHDTGLRCRLSGLLYRVSHVFSGLADRIDPVGRHPR